MRITCTYVISIDKQKLDITQNIFNIANVTLRNGSLSPISDLVGTEPKNSPSH